MTNSAIRLPLRRSAAAAVLAALLASAALATPAAAEGIPMGKVKRLNKAYVRDQCFDVCLDWEVRGCKRVSHLRARCKATVVFAIHDVATRCRITNRWELDERRVEIYEISKRCRPV